jgi:MSHA pilin protein MshC
VSVSLSGAEIPAAHATGFTLVELLACIVIIGVLAAVAGPRFVSDQTFKERGYLDEVASALRYAQRIAVASGCPVSFTINASGYQAFQQAAAAGACSPAGAWTVPVMRSDGTSLTGSPPTGVSLSPSASLIFDQQGAVSSGAPPTLTVGALTLTVDAGTGLVTVP